MVRWRMYRMGANFITDNQAVYRWNNKQGTELCHVVAVGHQCRRSRSWEFSCKFIHLSAIQTFPISHFMFFRVQYCVISQSTLCHTLYCVQSKVRATRHGRKYHDNWQPDFARIRPQSRSRLRPRALPFLPSTSQARQRLAHPNPRFKSFNLLSYSPPYRKYGNNV